MDGRREDADHDVARHRWIHVQRHLVQGAAQGDAGAFNGNSLFPAQVEEGTGKC